jgi:dTDP-6-deoxy-L-talose 4-dehydrogenase (NAD+)
MRVAVTGATGFIGRHVVGELAHRGCEVVAMVRADAAEPFPTGVEPLVIDLGGDAAAVFDAAGRPDVLMHLAWGGLPNYKSLHHVEQEQPLHFQFLKAMVLAGLKNLLVSGTCFEYGMQSGALDESMATQPSNPYGTAKDTLRKQLENLRESTPYNLTWARLFYLYGDGQAAGSLYPQIKRAVVKGDRSFDMSQGEQLRDYLPVSEMVKLLVELALTQEDVGVVNVCSGHPISVRSLVEGWAAANAWNIEFNFGKYPYPDYEPMAFWGCNKKLQSVLKAAP